MLGYLRRRARRRWFARELKRERQVRELQRRLWDMTPAATPVHKLARFGHWYYVAELERGRWRTVERFATAHAAGDWIYHRMRERFEPAEILAMLDGWED